MLNVPVKAATTNGEKLSIDSDICKTCGVCTGKCPFKAVAHESDTLYQIFVGGTWGKNIRHGTPLSYLVQEKELFPILEKVLLWYHENGFLKERLGMTIDRLGMKQLESALADNSLLARKEEILATALLQP